MCDTSPQITQVPTTTKQEPIFFDKSVVGTLRDLVGERITRAQRRVAATDKPPFDFSGRLADYAGGLPTFAPFGQVGPIETGPESTPLLDKANLTLADLMQLDPSVGFEPKFRAASAPLVRAFERETLPGIRASAQRGGNLFSTGRGVAEGIASQGLTETMGDLADKLFGGERDRMVNAAIAASGMAPNLAGAPFDLGAKRVSLASARYDPMKAAFSAAGSAFQPLTMAQALAGDMESLGPEFEEILKFLRATTGGITSGSDTLAGPSDFSNAMSIMSLFNSNARNAMSMISPFAFL